MAFADTQNRVVYEMGLPQTITLAAACKVGDLLGYSSGWKPANAVAGTAIPARLVAGAAGVAGAKITAYALARVSGFTGATVGAKVYLAKDAAGKYTQTAPSTSGDLVQAVGYAVSATEAIVSVCVPNETTVA